MQLHTSHILTRHTSKEIVTCHRTEVLEPIAGESAQSLSNMNGKDATDGILLALAANRAYAEELQQSIDKLSDYENELQASIQQLRQRLATRRADRAMAALGWNTSARHESGVLEATNGDDGEVEAASVFAKEPENRYTRLGYVPRSYIRERPSFFSSPEKKESEETQQRKRQRAAALARLGTPFFPQINMEEIPEPIPNIDTLFLRQHSHEAFQATPPKTFKSRERDIVVKFARAHLPDGDASREIPLKTWNEITKLTRPAIQRSGFACKLRWELHDKPGLRLCAWTKDEDRALKELASGAVDPSIVNNWAEIAKRMPIPGRPAVHCLTRYMTKLCPTNLNEKFTPEEDEMLRRAVEVFGERWNIIADLMDGRISEQLRHRWQFSLSPNVKQGKFTIVEDRRLLLALYAYMDRDEQFHRDNIPWHHIIQHTPGRPAPPVRDRFVSSLNPEVTMRDWTPEEDAIVKSRVRADGFDCPGLWPRIAAELGNRTDNQVARRARILMPKEHRLYKEKSILTGGRRAALPTIFQRMVTGRPELRRSTVKEYARRSSYTAREAEDDTPDHEEDQSDSEVVLL